MSSAAFPGGPGGIVAKIELRRRGVEGWPPSPELNRLFGPCAALPRLEAIALESTKTIDIDEFVPRKEIDELYNIRPYYIQTA
jgi:hypothetical protein